MLCRCGIGTPARTIVSSSTLAFRSKENRPRCADLYAFQTPVLFPNDLSGASAHDHAQHRSLPRAPKLTQGGCGNFMQTSKVVRSRSAGPGK